MKPDMIKQIGIGVGLFIIVIVLGIGLTSIMSYTARDDVTETVNGITVATNGTLTDFGTSYPYIQDIGGCVNATGTATLAAANYTVVTATTTGNGFVLLDTGATFSGWVVNCTGVNYLKDTTASTGISALIVIFGTIGALAVLFVLVMLIKPFIGLMK